MAAGGRSPASWVRVVGVTMVVVYKVRDGGYIQVPTLLIFLILSKHVGFKSK
jgi:hypothetical protein